VDTAPLEKSFASADAPTKSASDSVVSEVKSANYSGAAADLTKLAQNAKLTPEQQQAVKDVWRRFRKPWPTPPAVAAADANKAAGESSEVFAEIIPAEIETAQRMNAAPFCFWGMDA